MIDRAHQLDPTDPEIRKSWVGKLSRAERIKFLEEYLAGETNDDAETRAGMQHYLEYLKARAKDHRGPSQWSTPTPTPGPELTGCLPTPRACAGTGPP